ncbi:MAG TPA: hypothetical protein VID03_08075 [Acidimicrobiia bacterium]
MTSEAEEFPESVAEELSEGVEDETSEIAAETPTLLEAEDDRPGIFHRMANRVTGTVVDYVNPDLILDQIDINALLEKVDINAVLARVDVEALLERVDINKVMERVDVERIVERAGIADIVADTTGAFAESTIDYFRRQAAAVDNVIYYGFQRVLGRRRDQLPTGPRSPGVGSA